MSKATQKYCLDANVLIQAWQKYYSPKICPTYWEALNKLGKADRVFLFRHFFEIIHVELNKNYYTCLRKDL